MKYIKTYEKLDDGPTNGDYVICKDSVWFPNDLRDFISTNIGIAYVSDINNANYLIAYRNAPNDIKKMQICHTVFINNEVLTALKMHKSQILHFSNNKEDMQIIIDSNKYNI